MKIQIDDEIIEATDEQAAALLAVQDNREYPVIDFPDPEPAPTPEGETPTE